MNTTNEGVTINKSNEELENQTTVNNKNYDSINLWSQKEENQRKHIALTSEEHENEKCPICGRTIKGSECSNGLPLVNALVCNNCDKRYVYPYRLRSSQLTKKELANDAWQNYLIYMQAELLIEMSDRIKSLSTNHSDVA